MKVTHSRSRIRKISHAFGHAFDFDVFLNISLVLKRKHKTSHGFKVTHSALLTSIIFFVFFLLILFCFNLVLFYFHACVDALAVADLHYLFLFVLLYEIVFLNIFSCLWSRIRICCVDLCFVVRSYSFVCLSL